MIFLPKGFDTLAPHYDWMELLLAGGLLQRARVSLMDAVSGGRILLVGEGHGRFLLPLGKLLPDARITCVDSSKGMLEVAIRRVERQNRDGLARIEWIHAELPEWTPLAGGYDLIVTNFFLDCFEGNRWKQVVGCLSAGALENGRWLVTDFALPSGPLTRPAAKTCLWLMYRFFRATTCLQAQALESPDPLLASHGFVKTKSRIGLGGFVSSQLWQRK